MIEDPREVERRRLLGIEYSEGPTREDLVDALEEVSFSSIILTFRNVLEMAKAMQILQILFGLNI